jgi:multiple sugar transport system permease protein
MKLREKRARLKPAALLGKSAVHAALLLGSVVMVLPFVWMLSTAFKPADQILAMPPMWIPKPPVITNFTGLLAALPFGRFFLNSMIVSLVLTGAQLFLCSLTGYAFAKLPFPGKNALFLFILSSMMIPGAVLLIPTFIIVVKLQWLNTWGGLLIPRIATVFGVFFMRQFIMNLPDDYADAARIDGMREFGIYARIILPLIRPALATLGTFVFIGTWNDFIWPLIVVRSDRLKTLPLGFAALSGHYGFHFEWAMAAAVITIAPMVVVFLTLQRYVIRGITLTGIR